MTKKNDHVFVFQSTPRRRPRGQVFDTHAADSEALVTFLTGLSSGSLVLAAVRDEAQSNMTVAAKEASAEGRPWLCWNWLAKYGDKMEVSYGGMFNLQNWLWDRATYGPTSTHDFGIIGKITI